MKIEDKKFVKEKLERIIELCDVIEVYPRINKNMKSIPEAKLIKEWIEEIKQKM